MEGIHLLYLEINKIFSLSCQPICNSALKKHLHTLLSATGQIKDQNDLASLQHFVLILGKVFDRLVNQYHEPNLYIGAYVLSVTTLPVLNLALDTLEVDPDSLGALHA